MVGLQTRPKPISNLTHANCDRGRRALLTFDDKVLSSLTSFTELALANSTDPCFLTDNPYTVLRSRPCQSQCAKYGVSVRAPGLLWIHGFPR